MVCNEGSANPKARIVSAFLSRLSFFYFGVIVINMESAAGRGGQKIYSLNAVLPTPILSFDKNKF